MSFMTIEELLLSSYRKRTTKIKCSVVSVSLRQSHLGLCSFLKIMANLRKFKLLNFKTLVNSLTPVWSWIENNDLSCRSSHRRCFIEKATLLKKRLWHRCFPVNFAKFLRAPFLQYTSGRLLLFLQNSEFH